MPRVNGARWRDRRLDLDLNTQNAAARLRISGGHLRNIENGFVVASDRLIRRAAKLYEIDWSELVADTKPGEPEPARPGDDGVPSNPPTQPANEPKGPKRRTNGKGTGPKRFHDDGTAA